MPYRRPYKRARYGKRDKYSVQQKAFNTTLGAGATVGAVIVPPTNVEGMRKVTHHCQRHGSRTVGRRGFSPLVGNRLSSSGDNTRHYQHRWDGNV